MSNYNFFRIVVYSNLEKMKVLINDILEFIVNRKTFFKEDDLFEIRVVLNELLVNALKHGNNLQYFKKIKIIVGVTSTDLILIIEDDGEGRNLLSNTSNINLEDINDLCTIKETGRGLKIVCSLCNNVKINKKGNKIIVKKTLAI